MAMKRISSSCIFLSIACALALLGAVSCSKKQDNARKAIEDYLKNSGVKEVKVDSFFINPQVPDKAYAGVTITYNFATAEGNLQKEYLGYILKQSGQGWVVENHTAYTNEEPKAMGLLEGKKIK
jgi:hypothetical protein